MKPKLLLFVLFLLTAHYAFSQRIQVEAGDTVAVIPINQIRNANVLFLQTDSLQMEINFLQKKNAIKDSLLFVLEELDYANKGNSDLLQKQIKEQDLTISVKDYEIKAIKRRYKSITVVTGLLLILSLIF